MIKELNLLVDKNLRLICEKENLKIHRSRLLDINNREVAGRSICFDLVHEMEVKDLIRMSGEVCIATQLGYKIHENGGWLKYLELLQEKEDLERQVEEQKEKNRKAKEDVETQKLIDDAKISRVNARFRFFPIIFTAIGLIISGISLYIAIKSKKEPIPEKELSESEVLKIIDSILVSNQTKKNDSLPYSNSELKK